MRKSQHRKGARPFSHSRLSSRSLARPWQSNSFVLETFKLRSLYAFKQWDKILEKSSFDLYSWCFMLLHLKKYSAQPQYLFTFRSNFGHGWVLRLSLVSAETFLSYQVVHFNARYLEIKVNRRTPMTCQWQHFRDWNKVKKFLELVAVLFVTTNINLWTWNESFARFHTFQKDMHRANLRQKEEIQRIL